MRRRSGFTLVELLVAMALTIFIMVILTQCFVLSIDTFVGLKALGDMQEGLRTATNVLRYDLSQDHFDSSKRTSNATFMTPGQGFLSINNDGMRATIPAPAKSGPWPVTLNSYYPSLLSYSPPNLPAGFLNIYGPGIPPQSYVVQCQPGAPTTVMITNPSNTPPTPTPPGVMVPVVFTLAEGTDIDSNAAGSTSALSPFCTLHMACRLKGNRQQSFYTASVTDTSPSFYASQTLFGIPPPLDADATLRPPSALPPPQNTVYRSQWAEVCYCLGSQDPIRPGMFMPTGSTEEPLNPLSSVGLPLYTLYRTQYMVVPYTDVVNSNAYPPATETANFAQLACSGASGTQVMFSDPSALVQPAGRTFPRRAFALPLAKFLSSAVVPNVLSFRIQPVFLKTGTTPPTPMMPIFTPSVQTAPFPGDAFFFDSVRGLGDNATLSGSATNPLIGLSITLRVWDNKTRQTRQVTLFQDL